MALTVEVNIDTQKIMARIKAQSQKATLALAQQVLKDSNYYAPMKTGILHKSAIIHSTGENATITWNPLPQDEAGKVISNTSYAARLYYGDNLNFSKEKNPNARARWFEFAKQNKLKEWEKLAQSFFS